MPTARNARGVDIIAYSQNGSRFIGVQVKALSKRNPVLLGMSINKVTGDFWGIVNNVTDNPKAFILRPKEIKERAHRGEKDGRVSYWLQPGAYDTDAFREAWHRIGYGNEETNKSQRAMGQIFIIDKQFVSDIMLRWPDHYGYNTKMHYIM